MSLVLSEPTSLEEVDEQCAVVEEWAAQTADVRELREATSRLAAIDEYLNRTSTEGRARVQATLRRLEVRIGEVLGPGKAGPPSSSDRSFCVVARLAPGSETPREACEMLGTTVDNYLLHGLPDPGATGSG